MLTDLDKDELGRAFGQIVQIGRISSTNASKHTAKVEFEDIDGLVSYDYPILFRRPGDYSLPDAGTLVVCLVAPGSLDIGFVLGCIYSDEDAPPTSDSGARVIAGEEIRLVSANSTIPIALANYVDDRMDTIQQTFDAHIHTTTATIGPSAVVGVISPPTSPIGALATVGSSKVVAE